MMDLFKQMNNARAVNAPVPTKKNSPANPDACVACGKVGMLVLTQNRSDLVCMNCGAVQGVQQLQNQNAFNNQNRPMRHDVLIESDKHIKRYVEVLYHTIFPLRVDGIQMEWVGTVKQAFTELMTARKNTKLHGTNLLVIAAVVIECLLKKKGTPIVRTKMVEYVKLASKVLQQKGDITIDKYEKYRTGKELGLRQVLEKMGCNDVRPTVYEYTIFMMSQMAFNSTQRARVRTLADLLETRNLAVPDAIARRTNDEIAAFVVFVIGYNFKKTDKPSNVSGIPIARLLNMYDALLDMNIKGMTFDKKSDLFTKVTPPRGKKNNTNVSMFKLTIDGSTRKCLTFSKPVIITEAKRRGFTGVDAMKRPEICALLMKHQIAGA